MIDLHRRFFAETVSASAAKAVSSSVGRIGASAVLGAVSRSSRPGVAGAGAAAGATSSFSESSG